MEDSVRVTRVVASAGSASGTRTNICSFYHNIINKSHYKTIEKNIMTDLKNLHSYIVF